MAAGNRLIVWVTLAMLAFAANSLLCRLALNTTTIDAASFTTLRIAAGALVLWLLVTRRGGSCRQAGNWFAAAALFAYAALFSFAYLQLPAATGALLLFGAVQVTMIGAGLWQGERLRRPQVTGFALAVAGLVGLLLPGLAAPPPGSAAMMLGAGVAWAAYTLKGKQPGDPTVATAGNFLRAIPMAALLSLLTLPAASLDTAGVVYAVASGGLASGLGYALWYRALPALATTSAATIQLSVPVIAALGGIVFLGETLTLRLVLASAAVLGGIALVIRRRPPAPAGASR